MRIEFRDSRDCKSFKPESIETVGLTQNLLTVTMKDKNKFIYPLEALKEVKLEPEIALTS